jgi:hypothetical protein
MERFVAQLAGRTEPVEVTVGRQISNGEPRICFPLDH